MTSQFAIKYLQKMKDSPVVNSPQVPFLSITLSEHTIGLYHDWLAKMETEAIVRQRATVSADDPFRSIYEESWAMGYPYHGAIGGAVTFEVGSTSIGYSIKARYHGSDETIDLTEYDLW